MKLDAVRNQCDVTRCLVAAFEMPQPFRDMAYCTEEQRTVQLDHPQLGQVRGRLRQRESAFRREASGRRSSEMRTRGTVG